MHTSATIECWRAGTEPEVLSAALFDGALVVFQGLAPVKRLVHRARAILQDVFHTDDPPGAESRVGAREFRRMAMGARQVIASDQVVGWHWRDTLAAVGYRPASTWFDRMRLRIVPSRTDIDHRRLQTLPPHRDTWASGIMAQVNWWLPLYPLDPTNTLLLWPSKFRCPVENGSGEWDFDEFKLASGSYPLLPVARDRPGGTGTPVVIEPGDILGFSAAHLHAGTSDASGRTRFGIDSRTVWDADRRSGRGAPNVDGSAGTEMWQWYKPPLPEGASR